MTERLNHRGLIVTDEGGVRANDEMRNDPARRAAVRAQIEKRQAAYDKAHRLVAEAAAIFNTLGYIDPDDDTIVRRGRDAVARAATILDQDSATVMEEPNEGYIGNKAAFGHPYGWTPEDPS